MKLDYKISDIPSKFIHNNLSNYQIDIIELKYHIYNRFIELSKSKPPIDCYIIIGEEVSMQWRTIQSIYLKIIKSIKS